MAGKNNFYHMMKDLEKRVLEKIEGSHMRPRGRWRFLWKNRLFQIIYFIAIISGGLATSLIIYLMVNNDWDLYQQITDNLFNFIILTLPYFWLILLLLLVLWGYYSFKNTDAGYRYQPLKILLFSLALSALLGLIFFKFGLTENIEDRLAGSAVYQNLNLTRALAWHHPEKGILTGRLIKIENDYSFILETPDKKDWRVEIEKTGPTIAREHLRLNNQLKVVGYITGANIFRANEIRIINNSKKIYQKQ